MLRPGWGAARAPRRGLRGIATAAEYLRGLVKVDYEALGSDRTALRDDEQPLAAVRTFLELLGSPHKELKAVCHVVGSKGKGSTGAILSSIMSRSGLRVGTYTSPHVVSLGERVLIDGEPREDDELLGYFRAHEPVVLEAQERTGWRLSFFEALTALSIKYFVEAGADLAVVEAGLGGARDATNVFDPPGLRLVVVTPLEREHTEVLGDTIEEIASAKVGVVKPGTPVVVAPQSSLALENLVAAEAERLGCGGVIRASRECHVAYSVSSEGARDYMFALGGAEAWEIRDCLVPQFVAENARTAIAAAAVLAPGFGVEIGQADVAGGLRGSGLPGRFQVLGGGAAVLDGAHTQRSARVLVDSLLDLFPGRPVVFAVAMGADKRPGTFLGELARARPREVVCTAFEGSLKEGGLLRAAREAGLAASAEADFGKALEVAEARAAEVGAVVVATGSFRTVREYLLRRGAG